MVLRVAAAICLFVTLIIFAVCPFFRRTRRGILVTHWMIINWLNSTDWETFKHVHEETSYFLLLPIATLMLAADQLFKQPLEDKLLCQWNFGLIILFLTAIDATIVILCFNFAYEAALTAMFVMIFVLIIMTLRQEKSVFERSFKGLMCESTNSLFNNYSDAFQCFGSLGYTFYLAIVCNLLREIMPYLQLHRAFTYFIYLFFTIGTLNFVTTPAYVGGLIQTTKVIGAAVAEYGNQHKRLDPLLV